MRQAPRTNRQGVYNVGMMPEIVSIVTVGIALAGLILNGQRQMREGQQRLRDDVADLRREVSGMNARLARLEGVVSGMDTRLLRLEGVVNGMDVRVSRLEGAVSTAIFNRPSLAESAEHGD